MIGATRPRLEVLGAMTVREGEAVRSIRGRSASILAVLASARRSWLPWDVLAEEAWARDAPRRGAVHTAISRCRTTMGTGLAAGLESGPLGYRLTLDERGFDLVEFEARYREAVESEAAGRPADVVDRAERALGLWSGRPFANVDDSARVDAFCRELERRQLDLVDAGARAALAFGDGDRWVARLESSMTSEPLRQSTSLLLADCHRRAGNRAAAMRTLQTLRRNLRDVGLAATSDVEAAERRILADDPAGQPRAGLPPSFVLASLTSAKDHLAARRFRPALLEAERVISQQARLAPEGIAEAWVVVALACDALVRPVAVRHAVTEAVKAALEADASLTLRKALALAARATAPSEPNQGVVVALERADLEGEDETWALGAIAVNVACGAVTTAAVSAMEVAGRALRRAEDRSDDTLRMFAAECWLRVTEGDADLAAQVPVADRWADAVGFGTLNYAVAIAQRALRVVRTGDRTRYEADIERIERCGAAMGLSEDLAISMQMRASLLCAEDEQSEAAAMIEAAADLVSDHPVHQEVAAIQRWWLTLDRDPTTYLNDVEAVAALGRSPAYRAILAYTLFRADDAHGAATALDTVFDGTRLVLEPDGSFPTAAAGIAEVVVWLRDADRCQVVYDVLRPYAGQMLIAPGQAFVLGAADRFIGLLAAALGRPDEAIAAFDAAVEMERRMGFGRLASATEAAAAAVGVRLR